jgi:hypothetical protein
MAVSVRMVRAMKHFSRFQPDYATEQPVEAPQTIAEGDPSYGLTLAELRDKVRSQENEIASHRQAFEFIYQVMLEIASRPALPPIQKRRAEACVSMAQRQWPGLAWREE